MGISRFFRQTAALVTAAVLTVTAEAGQVTLDSPQIQWNQMQAAVTYHLTYTGKEKNVILQVSLLDTNGKTVYQFTPFLFQKGEYNHVLNLGFGGATGRGDASYQIRAVVTEPSGETTVLTNPLQVPVGLSISLEQSAFKMRSGKSFYQVLLQYRCGKDAIVTCAMYNQEGNCIAERSKTVSAGTGIVSFQIESGKGGRELTDGEYFLSYCIADAAGSREKGSDTVCLKAPTRMPR